MADACLCFSTSSEEGTRRFGEVLGSLLAPGMTVLLSGELGTGKTVLARGIGDALGVKRVRSPTFTLVNEYPCEGLCLVHADLYRLTPENVGDLSLEDYLDEQCVLLVEWPERWKTPPEHRAIKIVLTLPTSGGEDGRFFTISGEDGLLQKLRDAVKGRLLQLNFLPCLFP